MREQRRHHHQDEHSHDHHEHGPHAHGPHSHRGGKGRGRGEGERVRRGEARYVLLDALRSGPRHGYEIIKELEERSSGRYSPSPGTVYPTLQYLEELQWVRAEQQGERRIYHLTEAGQAELEAHAEEVSAFWGRRAGTAASHAEIGFLQQELDDLTRTVWQGLRGVQDRNNLEAIRRVRLALEHCKNDLRRVMIEVGSDTAADSTPNEKN